MDTFELILKELVERSEHEFHKYTPHQGQADFHKSLAPIRLIFGGNRSGKSRASSQEIAYWFTHNHPHRSIPKRVNIWVISTEYQTIKEGIYAHLKRIIPQWEIKEIGPRVQGHDLPSYIKSKRDDVITFLSAKGADGSRTKFQAADVHLIVIDEEIDQYIWDELQARTITTGGKIVISATLVESYQWIVDLENEALAGSPDVFLTRLRTQLNPYNDQATIARLSKLWDDDTKRYRLEGHSRRSSGLIYKNFQPSHIIEPFTIPKEWPRWHVYDPGFRIAGAIWGTITPHNQAIIYREYYQGYAEIHQTIQDFQLLEADEEIDLNIIDDKKEARLVTGAPGPLELIATQYHRYYIPATKSVHAGIEAVRKKLVIDESIKDIFEINGAKLPLSHKFFVFNTCVNWLQEISMYRFAPPKDRKDRNDVVAKPIKKRDHLMDPTRYWLVLNPQWYVPERITKREVTIDRSIHGRVDRFMERMHEPQQQDDRCLL